MGIKRNLKNELERKKKMMKFDWQRIKERLIVEFCDWRMYTRRSIIQFFCGLFDMHEWIDLNNVYYCANCGKIKGKR